MPKGIPLTQEEQRRRRHEIMDAAARLFCERGFAETSMRDIAEAAGAGKSTLYDYFETKDDILIEYFDNEVQTITARIVEIERQDLPAPEKLRRVLEAHLDFLLDNRQFYLKLSVEAQRLNQRGQERIQRARHAYQDTVARLIQAGIAEGSFRPVDPLLTMRMILAAVPMVAFTTRPTGTTGEMLSSAMDILMHGLLARPVEGPAPVSTQEVSK